MTMIVRGGRIDDRVMLGCSVVFWVILVAGCAGFFWFNLPK
jgi:UDP-N-acetylmuramyl pentapeptide phosphotransferase/UDP-N-acetylglucosamine-1-phosphate transferase